MKRTAASGGATIAIVAIAVGLAGCGSSSTNTNGAGNSSASGTVETSSAAAKPQSKVAPRLSVDGPNPSIASYFKDSHITATPVHRGDPGAPTIDFPIPDGWADAGPDTPATAYRAIVDNGPEAAKYAPSIVATLSKINGDADPQKIMDNAAGETKNLPGFKPTGDGSEGEFAGSPAYQGGGTWADKGQTTAVAQK